jgi:hypothetical protein
LQDGDEETIPLVEINLISMLQDEPNHSCWWSSKEKVHTLCENLK